MSFRDRRQARRTSSQQAPQGGGFDSAAFGRQMENVGAAQGTRDAQRQAAPREMGQTPTPGMRAPQAESQGVPATGPRQPAPREAGGFDAGAFQKQMNSIGTAQGTQEAQAQGPAGQKRRLSSVRVQGM